MAQKREITETSEADSTPVEPIEMMQEIIGPMYSTAQRVDSSSQLQKNSMRGKI